MTHRRSWIACATACLLLAVGAGAFEAPRVEDPAGQRPGDRPVEVETIGDTLGALCGTCPDPAEVQYFGLAFQGDDLWMVANDGTMIRTRACQTVETRSIQGFRGFATDLTWDARRGRFVVTDAELDEILIVDPEGNVLQRWPSPFAGPIGIEWDPKRDVYWVADWQEDAITAIEPVAGQPISTFPVPSGSRITGLGYDPVRDLLYYNGRNQRTCYAVSPVDHELRGRWGLRGYLENGEGVAVRSDGNVFVHHFEARSVLCFLPTVPDGATPVRETTWGGLKARYRR
jgi:hypothetical protein